MSSIHIEIMTIAVLVATACAIVGTFLVLRKMAMLSDAISHSILLGIVVGFFAIRNLSSPILIIAAAATGLLTVVLVEVLLKTRLLKQDAAIGIVFPFLFAVGVVLVARFADDIHLDTDAVLLGEIAFAPFNRLVVGGLDLGPVSMWVMLVILAANILFVALFFKELKITIFDAGLAASIGISVPLFHYTLMTLVSLTAVGSFDAVGSILVVALMVGPPAAAYLLANGVLQMLFISVGIGAVSAVSGYWLATALDSSIAGSMTTMVGVCFLLVFIFAPERGLIRILARRSRRKLLLAVKVLLVHISHHEGRPESNEENRVQNLHKHLIWNKSFIAKIIRFAETSEYLTHHPANGMLHLTDAGRSLAQSSIENG